MPRRRPHGRPLKGSLREHFRVTGDAKVGFDEEEAKGMARRHGKRAYECSACGRWHVGG